MDMSPVCEVDQLPDEILGLPPLPQATVRLFEILRNDSASLADLEEIILCDQSLTAKILQMANSAYYGSRGKIGTLSRAVMTMGFHEVKSCCLFFLLSQLLSDGNGRYRSETAFLWKHSLAVAKMAREIVRQRPWIDPERAYTLGLLHDMGRLIMLLYYHGEYQKLRPEASLKLPLWEDESRCEFHHSRLGRWVAIRWALPDDFRAVMEFHHVPVESPQRGTSAMIVHLADLLSQYKERPELVAGQSASDCRRQLCIPDDEWGRHIKRSESIWKEVDQLWAWLG